MQEVTGSTEWREGAALVILVTGQGERTAESFEGGEEKAALLHLEFMQYKRQTIQLSDTRDDIMESVLTGFVSAREMGLGFVFGQVW